VSGGRRRALGQHFLGDPAVARAIVEAARLTPADLCVEIGPGEGALTALLAARAGRLIALEVDGRLADRLRARLGGAPHVEIRLADARRFDYAALPALRPSPEGRVVVVGNLPYSVAKPILQRLVEARAAIAEMVLMLQREVALRVAAPPGSKRYGPLAVFTQLHSDVRPLLTVPPGAFRPPPKVDSTVLHLRMLPAPRVAVGDAAAFRRLVRAAFGQRRKTLVNALAAGLGAPPERVRQWLRGAGIEPTRRAETLALEELARLNSFARPGAGGKMDALEPGGVSPS
jgi:16S rRNA (adenine1518-N6/adenine1519-N6)-dimethyltransferase